MNELQKMLDRVFNLISVVPVQGDSVEIMAEAKSILRLAFKQAADEEKEVENG